MSLFDSGSGLMNNAGQKINNELLDTNLIPMTGGIKCLTTLSSVRLLQCRPSGPIAEIREIRPHCKVASLEAI